MDKDTKRIPFVPRFSDGRGEIIEKKERIMQEVPAEEELTEENEQAIEEEKKSGKFLPVLLALVMMVAAAQAAEALDIDIMRYLPEGISHHFASEEAEVAQEPVSEEEEVDEAGAAEEEPSEAATDEAVTPAELAAQLEVLEHDINYSQQDKSFQSGGVHVLMKVRNDSGVAVGSIHFTVENAGLDGTFEAFGWAGAGETGWMHGLLYIPDDSPSRQGTIRITSAEEAEDPPPAVTGKVSAFHKERDTYDLKVTNTGSDVIRAEGAYVVALQKGYKHLRDCWGAGALKKDLPPGEKVKLKDAIYNPGFESYESKEYELFVIPGA